MTKEFEIEVVDNGYIVTNKYGKKVVLLNKKSLMDYINLRLVERNSKEVVI